MPVEPVLPERKKRKKKLLIVLAATVGALLLCEAVLRARFFWRHGTLLPVHTFARDAASGIPIPVPGRATGAIRIDSRGFRNPELEVPKPPGRVRLAFLGASTTFCAEASGDATTWPHLVAAEIAAEVARAQPDASVDFVNAGVAGHVLRHMALNLEHRLAPLEPDVIVVYEAANDLSKDTLDAARAQGVYAGHGDSGSWLSEASLLWSLVEKNVTARARSRAVHAAGAAGTAETAGADGAAGAAGSQASAGAARLELDLEALEASYRERYAALLRRAAAIAPVVVAVTFTQRARADLSPAELERACITHAYYMPYMAPDQVIEAFAAYNRAIRAAARETGAILIECEHAIPADGRHFADSMHFTDEGCRAMAGLVAGGLRAAPAFAGLLRGG